MTKLDFFFSTTINHPKPEGISSSEVLPGSSTVDTGVPTSNLAADISSQFHASIQGVSETTQSQSAETVVSDNGVPEAESNALSDAERKALFDGLRASLAMKESLKKGVPDFAQIQKAIEKNPTMMVNLRKLQNMGAQLVITHADQTGVEFADVVRIPDVVAQQEALAGLSAEEKKSVIDQILGPIDPPARLAAGAWFEEMLKRYENAQGLNWPEAMVFAVAHGGTLISCRLHDAMINRNCTVFTGQKYTWYIGNVSIVMECGVAPLGERGKFGVVQKEDVASVRNPSLAVRVAGLRVEIA